MSPYDARDLLRELADEEQRRPAMHAFKCDPPYHRVDCHGSNCDDLELAERAVVPINQLHRSSRWSSGRGKDPGLFC